MSDELPHSLDNLNGAAVRALIAPIDVVAQPEKLSDIFAQRSPYTKTTGWIEVGSTAAPAQVSRNYTKAGLTIEQENGPVLEDIQENTYTVQIPMAELRAEILAIAHNSSIEALAATATDGSATKVRFGNVFDLENYRVALVTRFKKRQGVVIEGAGAGAKRRGRWGAYVAYQAELNAENVQTTMGKNQLAQWNVTFKLNPLEGEEEGEEHGFWIVEDAQTLITP